MRDAIRTQTPLAVVAQCGMAIDVLELFSLLQLVE
jgi:hypothetical protein